jgi:hypothetical protein
MSIQAVNPMTCWPGYCLPSPMVIPAARRPLAQAEAFATRPVFQGFHEKLATVSPPRLEILS